MAGNNTRVNILVEGQTEETFVRELLVPHLTGFQVWLTPRIVETRKGFKGGAVSYGKIKRQIQQWCQQDPTARVTTLFDVYGLPSDFPGVAQWNAGLPPQAQATALETNLAADVGQANLIPYLQLHEYEALLFSNLSAFSYANVSHQAIAGWQSELAKFAGPEDVNNSPATAPSKRLIARWPTYEKSKPQYGVLLAIEIGLPAIRAACPRFNAWVSTLEGL
ncbi:MAG TPA: DUF4276 family protein [Sulfuricella sp.]|nr:DUF4276 family protein [Dehalococcoidia bacterium]HUW49662.1 DUF4276 family protein [Sulfuricella sp.]